MRILHLGFEDHRRPGSGGGSLRNHEINRRLAARHEITVVTARYEGARDRIEDGVRYVHAGRAWGYSGSILSYFASLPAVLRRHPSDIVIEDFAAPFSSSLLPLWSKRPVVGNVQWLFAREKSRQYRLPFFLVESLGVPRYHTLIALSDELATELRRRNSGARIVVIGMAAGEEAWQADEEKGTDLVFLGRLEIAQKGIDLLLEAFARVAPAIPNRLVLVGDGIDERAIRRQVRDLNLDDRVELAGRRDGLEKYRSLRQAQIVCMPSRYETFGLVAAEALATGTPVLAFDIPCLREIVTAERGVLVPAFDVTEYARALRELALDPARCHALGARARGTLDRASWDDLADRQEQVYEQVLAAARHRVGAVG